MFVSVCVCVSRESARKMVLTHLKEHKFESSIKGSNFGPRARERGRGCCGAVAMEIQQPKSGAEQKRQRERERGERGEPSERDRDRQKGPLHGQTCAPKHSPSHSHSRPPPYHLARKSGPPPPPPQRSCCDDDKMLPCGHNNEKWPSFGATFMFRE